MDFNSSAKKKDARTPTPRRIKTSEKRIEAEDSHVKLTTRQKPGLSLEKKIEIEKRRRHVLINEHNRLTFAVEKKEARLKELQEVLNAKNLQPTNYNSEDTLKQRIRQLENNLDKMKMKITEAVKIQTVYQGIPEHLQEELRDMSKVLDQKERAVIIGQAEVDKATKQFQSAAAAADSTLGKMIQMEHETMEKKTEMDRELCELSAEEKELKELIETLGRLSLTGPSRLKERDFEEEEEEAHSIPVKDHQCYDICGASPSDMRLVEDMEALREALGCADVQDLVNKVVSQRATKEQLLTELTQWKELVRQEAKTLADLEVRYAELKFGAKPATTRFETLEEQIQARLKQEKDCVKRLRAELKQSQGLLDTVERGVNNLFFRMSCVPVEGLPSASSTDSIDKVRDIKARLPTLQQRALEQKPVISDLDQERVYSLLEQCNMMEPRNIKRPTTPLDTLQLSDDEEVCAPSREEIKRSSIRLIESNQNKKSSRRARKKQ